MQCVTPASDVISERDSSERLCPGFAKCADCAGSCFESKPSAKMTGNRWPNAAPGRESIAEAVGNVRHEFASGIMEKPQENCDDSAEFPGMVQQLRPSGNTFLESPGPSY